MRVKIPQERPTGLKVRIVSQEVTEKFRMSWQPEGGPQTWRGSSRSTAVAPRDAGTCQTFQGYYDGLRRSSVQPRKTGR